MSKIRENDSTKIIRAFKEREHGGRPGDAYGVTEPGKTEPVNILESPGIQSVWFFGRTGRPVHSSTDETEISLIEVYTDSGETFVWVYKADEALLREKRWSQALRLRYLQNAAL